MTGYHIRLGYNRTANSSYWDTLVSVATRIRLDRQKLLKEVFRERAVSNLPQLIEIIDAGYSTFPTEDATFNIAAPVGDTEGEIMILASGGGEWRDSKELIARAFCRLLTLEMNQHGIEITVVVA